MDTPCIQKIHGPSVAVRIGESGYTRLCGRGNRYAIGDRRGKPVTGYDFIYVSKSPFDGAMDGVEVVTGRGERRKFVFTDKSLVECAGGVGVGGAGGPDATGVGAVSGGANGGDGLSEGGSHVPPGAIDYGDVKDEITAPVLGRVPLLWGGPAGCTGKRRKYGVLALSTKRGKRRNGRIAKVSRRG